MHIHHPEHNHEPDKRWRVGQTIVWIVAVIGMIVLGVYFWQFQGHAATPDSEPFGPTKYVLARVIEATDQPTNDDPTVGSGISQEIKVKLDADQQVVDIGVQESSAPEKVHVGERVIVSAIPRVDGSMLYSLIDAYRMTALALIFLIFLIILLIFAGIYGLTSLAGLVFSIAVLGGFIVPQILSGHNPLLISAIGAVIVAALSLYLAHGFSLRVSIAMMGTLITVLLAMALGYVFVRFAGLTGNGSEEAFYLAGSNIDLRGLLLGGIVIGTLGVLGDITTGQAAVVEQLHHANPLFSISELYRRGFLVGREHIIALVNTLALAYVGASLPLLLLFVSSDRPLWIVLNGQMIAEEVVRTLVGSTALILAVPITTYLAATIFHRYHGQQHKH